MLLLDDGGPYIYTFPGRSIASLMWLGTTLSCCIIGCEPEEISPHRYPAAANAVCKRPLFSTFDKPHQPSENAKTVRWHTRSHFGFRFLCPPLHPRIMSVRTGRLGNFINRATAPDPDRRTATPGASRYRFSTNTIDSPPRKGGTARNLSRQRDNDDGRTAGPPGPREGVWFGRRNRRTLFFTFVSLVRLILLVPFRRRRVWGRGRCHRARSWVLHAPGRDGRQETG